MSHILRLFLMCAIAAAPITFNAQYQKQNELSERSINIGLLIQDRKSVAAGNGAELAIKIINKEGGINGIPVKLMVRSMEGPWGSGSKEAVNLIYNENVCALIGSHDGRNAHLAEQVSAKERIVFINAWSGDPTLSQAFLPWYYSVVPNNLQQADAMIKEILNKRKLTRIAALSDNSYDSKLALKSFVKKCKENGKSEPLLIYYNDSSLNFNNILDKINTSDINGILLLGNHSSSKRIIVQLRQRNMTLPVFGSLAILSENNLSENELKYFEDVTVITSGQLITPKGKAFRLEYLKAYGKYPDETAAFAYDAINLLIEVIKNSGTERENIQKYFKNIKFEGVTGTIQFDEKGNRIGVPKLLTIE